MTKQEALELETNCEAFIKENCDNYNVEISMNLAGKLRIRLDDNFICLNPKNNWKTEYISWKGDYQELKLTQRKLKYLIREFSSDFEKLVWSYENRTELVD